jgi:putative oxidoreductase
LTAFIPVTNPRFSLALLLLRIIVGASFLAHGAPKLAHPTSWAEHFALLPGIPSWLQLVVVIAETVGGLCILAGFLTPIFAFLQACDMLVAGFIAKAAHGFPYVGPQGRGFEIEAHLMICALVLLVCGPGLYSLDALLFARRKPGYRGGMAAAR